MNPDTAPILIPLGAFAMVLGIVLVINVANYHFRKLKSEERLAAISKGIPLPPEEEADVARTRIRDAAGVARGIRTGGIICVSVGVGLALFSFFLAWIVQEHDVLAVAAAGLIPLAVGVGLLVDYALRNQSARAEAN